MTNNQLIQNLTVYKFKVRKVTSQTKFLHVANARIELQSIRTRGMLTMQLSRWTRCKRFTIWRTQCNVCNVSVASYCKPAFSQLAVLPTRFGKSLCYRCLPLVFDLLYKPAELSISAVITPLIQDQVF